MEHADRIRAFYLNPRSSYSLADLAELWQISYDDCRALFEDEAVAAHPDDVTIPHEYAAALAAAHCIVRPVDVERALGDDFARACREDWRTVPVEIHLPAWLLAAIRDADWPTPANSDDGAAVERALLSYFFSQ